MTVKAEVILIITRQFSIIILKMYQSEILDVILSGYLGAQGGN